MIDETAARFCLGGFGKRVVDALGQNAAWDLAGDRYCAGMLSVPAPLHPTLCAARGGQEESWNCDLERHSAIVAERGAEAGNMEKCSDLFRQPAASVLSPGVWEV